MDNPHIAGAQGKLAAVLSAWEELHQFCLDHHEGYDQLFRACLVIEDSGMLELPYEAVRKALGGRTR